MSETVKAYLAGLVDGDGCIGIKRRRPSKANRMVSFRYCVYLTIEMTDFAPIKFIADFCGCPQLIKSKTRGKNKTIHCFAIEHTKAEWLICEILPYLIAKKKQAVLALELRSLQKNERQHRTKVAQTCTWKGGRYSGKTYRVLMHSDEYIARLDALYIGANQGSARSGKGACFR